MGKVPSEKKSIEKKSILARKMEYIQKARETTQRDVLSDLKNYDEIIFQQNMQEDVLKRGMDLQNLKLTE